MKILWVKTDFLHPTTRGGQIRTLEMVRQLHRRHEVHYVALDDESSPEGPARAGEYSSYWYAVPHRPTPKNSPRFAIDLLKGIFSELPVAGERYRSAQMQRTIAELESRHSFDARVCDFLFPSVNIPDLSKWTLFQHNVETIIWERHAKEGRTPAHRAYFGLQARKMAAWEQRVCRAAGNVIAVSEQDALTMKSRFGLKHVEAIPTGVDTEFFAPRADTKQRYDLVFVGSMDWMPNVDGMKWFFSEVLPQIKAAKPDIKVAVVGRKPPGWFTSLGRSLGVEVTGTVPDVRPYLWGSTVSIVPLRVGGGTRLKIFEAMAAGTPVVSTSIGAEGLPAEHGRTIYLADTAEDFASRCLGLLNDPAVHSAMSRAGREMVVSGFSWERVTTQFERAISTVAVPPVAVG